ncbi:MAG: amidohydrolase [Acidimicrobiia bacterium]|nr:amidohydrolase [Acidimicrobiia bacterium]
MSTRRLVGDAVFTGVAGESVIPNGVVDVDGATITYVGPAADAPDPVDRLSENIGGLLMPGLVNAHAHTPMVLLRGSGDGLPLDRWLHDVMWPREALFTDDDAWWGMALGSAEMLAAGVTTSAEMYFFEDAIVDATTTSGARLVMTPAVLPGLHGHGSRDEQIRHAHERHHDPDGRVTVGVAPHSAYLLGVDRCAELALLARELDTVLQIHLNETAAENAALEARHGGASTVALLADAGVFDGAVLAAHGVWLDDDDIATLAAHEVAVVHCPISNMKLGAGTARVVDMIEAGMTIALGTDGPASNNDLDLWEELKIAPLLARVSGHDAQSIDPATAVALATSNGGRALGLADVGRLASGMRADIIRLDLDDPAFVPTIDADDLVTHLVWSASGRHVTDVWVDGRRVVSGGESLTIDVARAAAEVNQRARRLAVEAIA